MAQIPSPNSLSAVVANARAAPLPLASTDLFLVIHGGKTYRVSAGAMALAPIIISYEYAEPVTGATVAATEGIGAVVLNPAGELATLTVVLPPLPEDHQVFELSSTQTLDDLTVLSSDGSTVSGGGPFLLAGNGGVSWRYVVAETTWFRRT